jgi:hypothetical protein
MAGVRSTYLGEAIGLPRQTARMLAQGEVVSLHKGCEDNLVVDGNNTPMPPKPPLLTETRFLMSNASLLSQAGRWDIATCQILPARRIAT